MNVPRADYPEFFARRLADVKYAAESGDGWPTLGRLWDVGTNAANEWSRQHAPREHCLQISQNGRRARKGPRLQSKPKPSNVVQLRPEKPCNHWLYIEGQAVQCGAPTKGKHACPSCLQREGAAAGYQRREAPLVSFR